MRKRFAHAQDPVSCWTHAAGAAAAVCGGLWMLLRGLWTHATGLALGAALCFCGSMAALYTASALYHYYPGNASSGGVKRLLRKMDHGMIYVLIAGSYTPVCLAFMEQTHALKFLAVIWGLALAGILIKLLWMKAPRALYTGLYLAMGWAIVFDLDALAGIPGGCLALIAAGGVLYSVGAVLYILKKPNFSPDFGFHELFHLFILAGSACHFAAVFFFVA